MHISFALVVNLQAPHRITWIRYTFLYGFDVMICFRQLCKLTASFIDHLISKFTAPCE